MVSVIASLQAVFLNQAFAPRPSRAGGAIPETPKPFTVIKELFFLVLSCGTTMSCGSMSKSKILERFFGIGVSYVQRMTPNRVETASVALYAPALSNTVRFFEPVLGRRPTPVFPSAKLMAALYLIKQTPQSPSQNMVQDGWSMLQLYQITVQVPSVHEPFPFPLLLDFSSFILHKPSFHTHANSVPLSGARVTSTLKGH